MKKSIRLLTVFTALQVLLMQHVVAKEFSKCTGEDENLNLALPSNPLQKQNPSNLLKLSKKLIDFSADHAQYDNQKEIIIIEGNIILKQDGKILKADRATFEIKTDKVHAEGNVTLQDETGNILYLESATLNGSLKKGFIKKVRILFSGGARLAAKNGTKIGTITVLNSARYSPCKVSQDSNQTPTWQMKASKITHNEKAKTISYKNLFLEIFGIPVFYTPYFSHPDPTVHAQSGFLSPTLGRSTELGVWFAMPYYFNLAPHKDFTFEPIITTNEGVVLGGTYRQHTGNGIFNISGSVARVNIREDAVKTGFHEIRGHISSKGVFDLPNIKVFSADWQWDYNLKWVSNDTYLRRYYADKSDVLQSHAKIEGFWGQSYATAGIYGFQGLKENDQFGYTAQALPSFEISTVRNTGFWNSKISFNADGVYIYRRDGQRTGRVSLQSGWNLPFNTPLGDFYNITASIRADFYNNQYSSLERISNAKSFRPKYRGQDGSYLKFRPRLALDWRMPFINNKSADIQHVLEPMISIILAPNQGKLNFMPNEDSRNFEFDENNLFSHNRFNGYDLWESGIRLNYGLRYNLFTPKITLRATLGQSLRLSNEQEFPVGSGYLGKTSDFVGRFDLSIGNNLDFLYRFRLDTTSFALRRNELIVSGKLDFVKASLRYLNLDRNFTDSIIENRKEVGGKLQIEIGNNFILHGNIVHDLLNNHTITYDAGITYKTDCLEFGIRYERRFTSDRDIVPSNALLFSLILKNLG